ncbi:MAG TPA: DUF4386 family protein [Ktedonobacterales bacterium]|nr:DUF4386 family protein [Ktedonobacterales bacterium]
MEIARLKLQGFYSLLAGAILLVGVPIYQAVVLAPAGYRAPSDTAFSKGDYGPLLLWIAGHGSDFIIFRCIELVAFLLMLRLPLALYRALRSRGTTLARWMVVSGLGGLILFAAMIALSTFTFVNTAASYSQIRGGTTAAQNMLTNFNGFYGVEALGQNTLGGFLIAIFLLCASLLIARSGKLSNLLVYFGLLAAALMAALALLFAVSPPSAQTQLNTPALASFAVWLIWLGMLLNLRAAQLAPEAAQAAAPADQSEEQAASGNESSVSQDASPEQAPVSSPPLAAASGEQEPPNAQSQPEL